MATQVFLLDTAATTHRGTNTAKLDGTTSGWAPFGTSTSRGSGVTSGDTNTVGGPTNGVEAPNVTGTRPSEWLTPPVDADVTISGTITGNIWAFESAMNANVAINFRVHKVAAIDGALTEIVKSTRTTELGFSGSPTVQNFTATPTSTALNKGDRLRITIFGDDAGTMGSGFLFSVGYNGTTAAASGDTYITFNETFGFQTTGPVATLGLTSHIMDNPSAGAQNFGTSSTAINARAQSFQIPSTATVDEVEMSLGISGTPTDNVVASIQADSSGEPSGTALTSGTYPMTSLTSTATPVRISMSPVSLTGSTTYWLVAERSGAADDNSPKWGSLTTNPYSHDSSTKTSGTWAASSTTDYHFAIIESGGDPPSNKIYLTDTASAVSTADTDYEAWTARGDAAASSTRNPGVGWVSPTQWFFAAAAASWFTRPLQAFTLAGLVKCNIRVSTASASNNHSIGVEVARVDGDGTNPAVWGYANRDAATTSGSSGEIATTETAYTVYVSGDDLSVSDGQRLRVRVFIDDCADVATGSGNSSLYIDGPTGGASGDTYLIFGQTLTESSPGVAYPFERVDRTAALRDTDPWSLTGWRS